MAEIAKLVPRLKFNIRPKHRRFSNPDGPLGRINNIGHRVTALVKYERIECLLPVSDETRAYAERLICEAVRHGDQHPPTMDLADFFLKDKQMIHKLFKVLVPRFKDYRTSVTEMYQIPIHYHLARGCFYAWPLCVLELRGNPYPPMPQKPKPKSTSLTNILLKEASKDYRKLKLNSNTESEKS